MKHSTEEQILDVFRAINQMDIIDVLNWLHEFEIDAPQSPTSARNVLKSACKEDSRKADAVIFD